MDDSSRLAAYDAMLADARDAYAVTLERMAQLKADGKEKTATYQQFVVWKLQYQQLFALYRRYGLAEKD